MLRLKTKLEDLERGNSPIRIGVVGAGETDTGQRGATLIEQIEGVPGITTRIVADSSINETIDSFKKGGIVEREIEVAKDIFQAAEAITGDKRVVDWAILISVYLLSNLFRVDKEQCSGCWSTTSIIDGLAECTSR